MRRRRGSWEGRLATIPFKSEPTAAPKLTEEEHKELDAIVQATMFPKELMPHIDQLVPYLQSGHRLVDLQRKYWVTYNPFKELIAQEIGYPGPLDIVGTIEAPTGVAGKTLTLPEELGDKICNILMFKEQYRTACNTVSTFVQKHRQHTPKQMVGICPELQWIIKPEDLRGKATTRPLPLVPDTTELRAALSFIRLMGGL